MQTMFTRFSFGVLLVLTNAALASHPNEGSLSLDQLIREASDNNFELKAEKKKLESALSSESGSRSAFMPEVSIETGQLETKYSSDRNSGTPLFGKIEWNLYRGGKDQSRTQTRSIETDLARKQVEIVRAKIERDVARSYYEQLLILEAISLKEKALEMNREQIKLAKAKNRSGFTSSADVIEFDLREATLRSDLKKLEQDRNDQSRKLSVLLGRNQSSGVLLVKGHLTRIKPNINSDNFLGRISNHNPEILESRAQTQIARQEHDLARAGYLPQIDLEGKFGKLANEERVFQETNGYSAFLKVKIPIFSGMSTVNERAATAARIAEREAALSQKQNLALAEAASLLSKISTIQERLSLEESNLVRSEEYYKITVGEYRRGVKNSPDMVGASERLIEARIRNLELRKELMTTYLDVLSLVGQPPELL